MLTEPRAMPSSPRSPIAWVKRCTMLPRGSKQKTRNEDKGGADAALRLSLIHISEPTRLALI
eukprot:6250528-Alexandrium_andersonii.AAC.1